MVDVLLTHPFSRRAGIVGLLLLALVSPLLASSFGAVSISVMEVLDVLQQQLGGNAETTDIKRQIILELRLPRVLLAFLAGAGLALSGAVLQIVTRNPLADPYLFGISSGASFGAVLVIVAGASAAVTLPLGAFAGSCLSVLMVTAMAGSGGPGQVERMLLAGVATSFLFGAATSLVLYFAEPYAAASVLFWTLGSFSRAEWSMLGLPLLVICISLLLFIGFSRQLNALLAGEESARTLGVNVAKLRLAMLLLASLMTAVLVAQCGGIGFVGLMVPHIVRLLIGVRTLHSLLLTALCGGLFMVWVDVLARQLLPQQELPVGIITAALGSLFFLVILRHRQRVAR